MSKKTEISFVDKNRAKVNVEITIEERDGEKRFSISGDVGGGCGQIIDSILPANEHQEKLIKFWKEYHLNDMKAGTPKQEAALDKWKTDGNKYDYTNACEYLSCLKPDGTPLSALEEREIGADKIVLNASHETLEKEIKDFKEKLARHKTGQGWFKFPFELEGFEYREVKDNSIYFDSIFARKSFEERLDRYFVKKQEKLQKEIDTVNLRTLLTDMHEGKAFTYGHGWITKSLPEDIEQQVEDLVSEIEAAEEERAGEPLDKMEDADLIDLIKEKTSFDGRDAELCAALVRMFELSENDLEDISIDGVRVTVQGTDYTAGNEEEMTEAVTEDIKQTLWAFNSSFLANQTDLPEEVFTALQPQCENANDAIEKLIDRSCGMESFVESAVSEDGRGHFLNRYDGTEENTTVEGTKYFAYRN